MIGKVSRLRHACLLVCLLALAGARIVEAQSTFVISPDTWNVAAAGGAQAITVTSSLPDAPWTASSSAGWLTVSTAIGSGDGSVTLTAEAHTTSANPRVATATIAGHTVTVTQAGAVQSFTLTPTSWIAPAGGASQDIELTSTVADAAWSASSSAGWLTLSPSSGTGSDTVTLTAAPHTTSAMPRAATATIAGQTVAVTQAGAIATFTLTPDTWSAPASGGSQAATLTSSLPDAPWTPVSSVAWLSSETTGVVDTAWLVKTLAGDTQGFADGTGAAAQFSQPLSTAVGIDGVIYVADRANHRIRRITVGGVVTTLAGSTPGFADGPGAGALFSGPYGVAVDATGTVYIADTFNNRIRKIAPDGHVTTLAGGTLGSGDGAGAAAQFAYPTGVAVDGAGNVYVADFQNSRIRKITPAGVVTTLAGSTDGDADGTGDAAQFYRPFGVTVTSSGLVYVADSLNHRIRRVSPAGEVTTLAGSVQGSADGTGAAAQFRMPFGLAIDNDGIVYVADTLNNRIRRVTPAGEVTTLSGSTLTVDGVGPAPQFRDPGGIAVNATARKLYVADSSNHRIQEWTLSVVGSAGFVVTAAPTTSALGRIATITVGAETLTVTQPGGTAVYGVSPTTWNAPAAGGVQFVTVTSSFPDASWSASSSEPWVTLSATGGTGGGGVTLTAPPYLSISARAATVTIAGQAVDVTQPGGSPVYSVDPVAWSAAASGGQRDVTVTSSLIDAPWGAVSSEAWLTFDAPGGTGNGSVTLIAAPHTTSALPRVATATIAGHAVSVTQAGATPTFALGPVAWNAPSDGGTQLVAVTSSLPDASWSASSGAPWLAVSAPTGPGSGTVTVTAAAQTSAVSRVGTITIAGVTFTVTQAAPPTMMLDRTSLNFGAINTGLGFLRQTSGQDVRLSQAGAGTVSWTAASNQPWLHVFPAAGTGPAPLTVSVSFGTGLPIPGAAFGQITITLDGAANQVEPIDVRLTLIVNGTSIEPFGVFDTPVDGSTGMTGSIALTGWALDDIEVVDVAIYRDPVSPEPPETLVFVGNAVMVDGARTDLLPYFPTLPRNTRGGWGYMLLTNMLPGQGNGTFRLHAVATDREGSETLLGGSPTITCDNQSSLHPFGAIDSPGQGAVVSGLVDNFGWVLVPEGDRADVPGGAWVYVFIDGEPVGIPTGWTGRPDISAAFPSGYANLDSTLAVYSFDTSTLSNAVHTIAWGVNTVNGFGAGVGSRYFTVANDFVQPAGTEAGAAAQASVSLTTAPPSAQAPVDRAAALAALPVGTPLVGRRGFDIATPYRSYRPGADGVITFRAEELDRIELQLGPAAGPNDAYEGFQRAGTGLAPLPIGSRLDPATGTFTWQPGVGFVGTYDFVFVRTADRHVTSRHDVRVVLHPKSSSRVGPQTVIDTPSAWHVVGQPFVVAGWAVDLDDEATSGVDAVHVWAYPSTGADPIFLGPAPYGGRRADVAAIHGDRFGASGFGLKVHGLEPGDYDLAVFAWSTVTQAFAPARTVRVTVR